MGLLDWLTEGIGSSMEGSSMPQTMPEPPMPPVQQIGADRPPPMPTAQPPLSFQRPEFANPPGAPPNPMTSDIGAGMQGGGLPPSPVPMPAPRPAAANTPPPLPLPAPRPAAAPAPSELPPSAGANGLPLAMNATPQAPTSLAPPPGATPALPGGGSFIGRALGLDANQEKSMFGSLGAGLTAAGNSKGKSKGQALFSGAGGALEGGQKTEDKAYDQRLKALGLDVKAKEGEDYAALGRDRLELSKQELKQNLDKMTGKGVSDSEKYVQAQQRAAADPEARGALAQLKDGSITPEQFKAKINEIKAGHLKGVGLDPNMLPPGTPPTYNKDGSIVPGTGNPHKVYTQADFDRLVKPGDYYFNPRNGRGYIKAGGAAPGASATPAAPAPVETPVASTGTDAEDPSNGT